MALSREYAAFIEELLEPLGGVRVKPMFGGGGVYRHDVMFGLISAETLYLKADDTTRAAYEAEGMGPFVYEGKGKPMTMPYWQVPERLYDEPDELNEWARTAFTVAFDGKKPRAGR